MEGIILLFQHKCLFFKDSFWEHWILVHSPLLNTLEATGLKSSYIKHFTLLFLFNDLLFYSPISSLRRDPVLSNTFVSPTPVTQ